MSELSQQERLDRRAHVSPTISEERLARSWEHVAAGRGKRPATRVLASTGLLLAAAAAGLLFVWTQSETVTERPWSGTTLSTAGESAAVHLADGSQIVAEPGTLLSLARADVDETRVLLTRGGAAFEIEHAPGRQFIVLAGDVQVRVVGTRFSVRRSRDAAGERIEVAVVRGIVEVTHAGRTRRLLAGMRWQTEDRLTHVGDTNVPAEPAQGEASPAPALAVVAPETTAVSPTADETEPARAPPPSASALFERASAARRAGSVRAAARYYASLVLAHPQDHRAGLAAFELGRLRMDALGDPRGASRALRQALRLAPHSPFREDAMARLVRAHESAGQEDACARVRSAYLSAYPSGRHANDIARRCDQSLSRP